MAKEIGAIFCPTSASKGNGIISLFENIGLKIINQNDGNNKISNENNESNIINNNNIIKENTNYHRTGTHQLRKKKKSKCC